MSNKKEEQAKNFLQSKFVDEASASSTKVSMPVNTAPSFGSPNTEYMVIPLDLLPCGMFYKTGTKISIRGAKVHEVQNYSVVDDKNYIDITDKMNVILKTCIRFMNPDNTLGSYKNVKDADRLYLIFMIRELTFPGGKNLSKEVTCTNCKHEFNIEFRSTHAEDKAKTFVNHEMPEELQKFFDQYENVYRIPITDKNGNKLDYNLAPPTIGLQEVLFGDIKNKVQAEKEPNVSFLKIIPFQLHDRIDITPEGIKAKEQEYSSMDMTTFQVLNQVINLMLFGIKELKADCPECGMEVRTDMSFPDGASSLFVISGSIDQLIG